LDCQAGTAPTQDDGVSCTDDSCDEVNDIIVNDPNDANCDDTLWCNGAETCDQTNDCQPGILVTCDDTEVCTNDTCNEIFDACVYIPIDDDTDFYDICPGPFQDCEDTDPTINPGSIEVCDGIDNDCTGIIDDNLTAPFNFKQHGVCLGSTKFCTGAEFCDPSLDCQSGTPIDIDDNVACTIDSCDEVNDVVVNDTDDTQVTSIPGWQSLV